MILAFLILAQATQAAAGPIADQVQTLIMQLGLLVPIVIFVSSLVLPPETSDKIKKIVPGVVSTIGTVLLFVVTEFPDVGNFEIVGVVLGYAVLVTGSALSFYAFVSSLFGGLNARTGSGLKVLDR